MNRRYQQTQYYVAFAISVIALTLILIAHTSNYNSNNSDSSYSTSKYSEYNKYMALGNQKLSFAGARILPIIDFREDLGNVLEDEGKATGVEVGVQRGGFAKSILSRWKSCQSYTLVDPWLHQQNYNDGANRNQNIQDANYETTKKNLAQFEGRTKLNFMRMFSTEAAKQIPAQSMDFVYLDARHDYEAVLEDLNLFWPKLKPNGILAGHDFINTDEQPKGEDWCMFASGQRCENKKAVKAAVQEFARKVNRQVVATKKTPEWASWYLRK